MTSYDVAVLGSGPSGLMTAQQVAASGKSVVVIDRAAVVGGMAGSFAVDGVRVDHGSHRMHRVMSPRLEGELRALLGNDLQERSRKGRIAFQGAWLGFPIRLGDLARRAPKPFLAKVGFDTLTSPLRRGEELNAADAVRKRLGPTMSEAFYTPYLTKLWGSHPRTFSVELADRRISARSGTAIIAKALKTAKTGGTTFLYPVRGFGQFSESLADAAVANGAQFRMSSTIERINIADDRVDIQLSTGDVSAATLVSTIPVPALASLSAATVDVQAAGQRLKHRAMVLVYLTFDRPQLTAFDAHYFPSTSTPVSRLSEPKNFRESPHDPTDHTVVCAEVACWEGDALWTATDQHLAEQVMDTLAPMGFDFPSLAGVTTKRISHCYPVFTGTYSQDLAILERWAAHHPRVLTAGRQGLFVTDNTHHVMDMGWEASLSIKADGTIDRTRWNSVRESFRGNIVED
jgi:protoporphyrinogen oxidase